MRGSRAIRYGCDAFFLDEIMLHERYACIRTGCEWPPLPYRGPVGVGPGPWPFRCAPDRAWPGNSGSCRGSGRHANGGDPGSWGCRRVDLVAEQLDLIGHIDQACSNLGAKGGPSVGELALAVAIQRACSPGPKRDLAEFLDGAVPRLSCLPSSAFSGQAYHRVARQVTDEQLEHAQIAIAKAAVARFELSADVLAFDTTNFDTHIATVTPGELARRGHAKSKRSDLRVVGLGVLVSETGHVPLLYRTYSGNSSDQAVLTACLDGLRELHQSLDHGECRERAQRTLVRDGGFWSPQLELDLDVVGYYSLISLPLGHAAAEQALQMAAKRGAMKPLSGKLAQVRAARVQAKVGNLDRTLVVVESQELLEGQKRGIAVALRKAKAELSKLDRLVETKRISRSSLEQRIRKTLAREHLSRFVGALAGSCRRSAVSGTSKNFSAGRRREAWCPGDRRISGRMDPYAYIPLQRYSD